jgi:hypothetical protein
MEKRRRKAVKQRGLGGFPHERLLNPKGLPQATAKGAKSAKIRGYEEFLRKLRFCKD